MDLDGIGILVSVALYWRVTVCVVATSLSAWLLVHTLTWFSGVQGLVLGLLGILPGIIWHTIAWHRKADLITEIPETRSSVLILSALLCGAAWGAASSQTAHSAFAGAAVLGFACLAWAKTAKRYLGESTERVIATGIAASLAYLLAALIAHNAV